MREIAIVILLMFLIVGGCKKGKTLQGDILVSQIENRTNYRGSLLLEMDVEGTVEINGQSVEFVDNVFLLDKSGYYEMVIDSSDTLQFVILDEERGEAEWGLLKWIPKEIVISDNFNDQIDVVFPKRSIEGLSTPVLFRVQSWTALNQENLRVEIQDNNTVMMKRGLGFVNYDGSLQHAAFYFGGQQQLMQVDVITEPIIELGELIKTPYTLTKNGVFRIKKDLELIGDDALIVEEGCIVLIDEGVNIQLNSSIHFEGSTDNPIWFTCSNQKQNWGGFIGEKSNLDISGRSVFFTQFADNNDEQYQYGHAKHQALFKIKNGNLSFDNCYFIQSPGQVFYPDGCNLHLNHCVVMKTKSGGQINNSKLNIQNSYFSDFPEYSSDFKDDDNDALYLMASDALISNSCFMNAKDDGLDTGGSEGGTISIDSCQFEACFHEGIAMSSSNNVSKSHTIKNSVFSNCQQGIELGYSSKNHVVFVSSCVFIDNYVGVRYGDNYENSVEGNLNIVSSYFAGNEKHTWNMLRKDWAPSLQRFSIDELTNFD